MYAPTFSDLAGDESVFFSTYFNKQPLLRKGALLGRTDEILNMQNIDQLLASEVVRPPYIRITKNGAAVQEETYTAPMRIQNHQIGDSVNPEAVMDHFRTGATITWNSLNQIYPHMRVLAAHLADRFAVRSDIIAFLTPAGKEGFIPHYDPVDLFIVQLEGTKYWQLWNPPTHRPGDYAFFRNNELGEPVIEATLEPGDVLYLPFNTPHVAAALDKMSLHLSIMVRPRKWSDLLVRLVEQLVTKDPQFWDFPYLNPSDRTEVARELESKIEQLTASLAATSASEAIPSLAAWGAASEGSRIHPYFSEIQKNEAIELDTRVAIRRASQIEIPYRTDITGSKLPVKVNGSTFAVPVVLEDSLRSLLDGNVLTVSSIAAEIPLERKQELVRGLLKAGILDTV